MDSAVLRSDFHPVRVYLASVEDSTREGLRTRVERIAAELSGGACSALTLPWHELRYQHVAAYRARVMGRYKPGTANNLLGCLKRIMRECYRLGYVEEREYRRIEEVPRVKGESLPPGRMLTQDELQQLFSYLYQDESLTGLRDCAMVATLYATGMRRFEVAKLGMHDYDPGSGAFRVVRGKGRKDRVVPAAEFVRGPMARWLAAMPREAGPLFFGFQHNRPHPDRPMTPGGVHQAVRAAARRAGVEQDFTTHDLRRTYISSLLDRGVDLVSVQRLAGHSSPTTARYDRRPEELLRRAAQAMPDPFGQGGPTA